MAAAVKTTVTELPDRACASRPRCPPPRSSARVERKPPASSAATCAARLPQGQGARRRSSSSASAARPCSTRPSATSLGSWYVDAIDDARHRARSASPTLDLGDLPARGRAADVLDRDRRAPEGRARRVQGPRGRPRASPTSTTSAIDARDRAAARARWPRSRPSSARPQRGRLRRDRLSSAPIDGEPFAGGEGRDQLIELGSGQPDPGLRGAARGRERRRGAHGRRDLPRRLPRRASSPARTPRSR